jgi:hypothetical protein
MPVRRLATLALVTVAALATAMATAPPVLAAPTPAPLTLRLSAQTSGIYLFDPTEGEDYFPAVTVTGRLTGCIPGADYFWEWATLRQDGHVLGEWDGATDSGMSSCGSVSSEPLLALDGYLHPGWAVVTMRVHNLRTSTWVSSTRWVIIPGGSFSPPAAGHLGGNTVS